MSQRNTPNQRNLQTSERRMRTSLLTGREPREQMPRNHMSRSVGILPNMQRKISKTPKRMEQFKTENNQRYSGKGINRSMTGLDMPRKNFGYHPHMQRKFSEVPDANNWVHKTLDVNRPRGSHISQNNILSFKKEASYENELYNRSHRGTVSYTHLTLPTILLV